MQIRRIVAFLLTVFFSFSLFAEEHQIVLNEKIGHCTGSSIFTTDYDNTMFNTGNYKPYKTVSGTSFAAPHVSAIAALILSVAPQLTGQQVVHLIQQSAQKIDGYMFNYYNNKKDGTWNEQVGYGLVDAYASLVTNVNGNYYNKSVNVDGCYVIIENCLLDYDSEFVNKSYICTQITGKFEVQQGGQFLVNTSFPSIP